MSPIVISIKCINYNNVDNNKINYNEFFGIMMDQSSGQGKMYEGALNKNLMSVKFGEREAKLRDTKIKDLGTYRRKLDFVEEDEGPFYLSPQGRICCKYCQPAGIVKAIERSKNN